MAQGMDDKIQQISEMLNSPEAQDGIRQLLNSFGAPERTASSEAGTQSDQGGDAEPSFMGTPRRLSPQDTDWINHIQNMLGQLNSVQDTRINLLHSVHPFLNSTRRERCTTCMNILKIASIVKAVTNNGGRLF